LEKSQWSAQNKGVEKRSAKDVQYEEINAVSSSELTQARRALEKKAVEYERMKRGWTRDLTDAQREEILVDFDAKYLDSLEDGLSNEEEDDDRGPKVEVVDEFGRTRMVSQTAVTRPLSPERELRPYFRTLGEANSRTNLIYGDYMPTFIPDEDKAWEINNREDKGTPNPSPSLCIADFLQSKTHTTTPTPKSAPAASDTTPSPPTPKHARQKWTP
jgi:hypothetical protein